jgi:glycosyltransferase involved in cell wall biosynthesis
VPIVAVTGGLLLGGSTTFLLNLLLAFQKRGLQLPVISLEDRKRNALLNDVIGLDADIRCVDYEGLIYEDRLHWAYQQVRKFQPRVVLACLSPESFEVIRLIPPGVMRIGVIQSHDPGPYEMARLYARWVDAMVGVSAEVCEKLRGMKEFASTRIVEIPYGIIFSESAPRQTRSESTPLRVIYVGRIIEEQKRMSRLRELIRRVLNAGWPIEFTIVGSGPEEREFREQFANVPQVRFLGPVPNAQVRGLLRKHDVFLLLSDYEGLPLSLLEAMSEGLVPVVSDLPSGIRQAVPDGCGIRVPVGNVEAALEGLRLLAKDPPQLAAISAAAEKHVREKFSAHRMAGDYLALVDQETKAQMSAWPESVDVSVPLGIESAWLYRGFPRTLRRCAKRITRFPFRFFAREPSSRS